MSAARQILALKAATLVWAAMLALASSAGLRDFLDLRAIRPYELYVRKMLGREPAIDPRLKLISLDDRTAAALGDNRLPAKDLVALLRAVSAAKPSVIMIDALFSSDTQMTAEEEQAIAALHDLPVRVAAGAAINGVPIEYRTELPRSTTVNNWTESVGTPTVKKPGFVYGPAPKYRPAFRQIGHLLLNDTLHFLPVIIANDGTPIPHMSLLAAQDRRYSPDAVVIDGETMPIDTDGRLPIDFVDPTSFKDYSMHNILKKARNGEALTSIRSGDVVIIFLNSTTGSTDFYDSPYGRIRGGHILSANVNSTLRRQWLHRFNYDAAFIFCAAALGYALGVFASATWFWPVLAGGSVVSLLGTALTFAYLGWILPSAIPLFAGIAPSLMTYAYRRHQDSQRHIKLQLDFATAATLQRHFFPPALVENEVYELAAFYHPAEAIGGDWFAYYADRDFLTVHVGDVTGHGTPAALVASFAKGATDMIYADWAKRGAGHPPLRLVHENLNDMLRSGVGELAFMTMFSVTIDLRQNMIFYLNSGHRPGLLVNDKQKATSLFTPNESTILGFEALVAGGEAHSVPLSGDATLVLLSDGLIDVPASYGLRISENKLKRSLVAKNTGTMTATAIRDTFLSELGLTTAKAADYVDDVTFIVLKLKDLAALRRAA